jgi:O-antigen/teichoic acid export membrane protein
LLFILVSPDLLAFFGSGFPAAQGALAILALGQLVIVGAGSVFVLLVMTAHQQAALRIQWGTVLFSLPLMLGLTYRYGITGIAAGNAVSLVLLNLWGAWTVWKILGIKSFISEAARLTVLTLAAFILSRLIRDHWGAVWAATNFTLLYLGIFSYTVWRLNEWRSFRVISAY